jgi:hypothetical protein
MKKHENIRAYSCKYHLLRILESGAGRGDLALKQPFWNQNVILVGMVLVLGMMMTLVKNVFRNTMTQSFKDHALFLFNG